MNGTAAVRLLLLVALSWPALGGAQQEAWVHRHAPQGLGRQWAADAIQGPHGQLYVAGQIVDPASREYDPTVGGVVALSPAGQLLWVHREGASFLPSKIRGGADGSLYVAGSVFADGRAQFAVLSLTASGAKRWSYVHRPGETCRKSSPQATALALGADGNVYAAGSVPRGGAYCGLGVVSLAPDGKARWSYRYQGKGHRDAGAKAIAVDPSGNVYVAGWSIAARGLFGGLAEGYLDRVVTVVSLTSAGAQRWVHRLDGPPGNSMANDITRGGDGHLYLAVGTTGTREKQEEFAVLSLDTRGSRRWVFRAGHGDAEAVAVGADGNVYAAGMAYGASFRRVLAAVSLTPAGVPRWSYRHRADADASAAALATGPRGEAYVVGSAPAGAAGGRAAFTVIGLDPQGRLGWTHALKPAAGEVGSGGRAILVRDGRVYAAGSIDRPEQKSLLTVLALDPVGAPPLRGGTGR